PEIFSLGAPDIDRLRLVVDDVTDKARFLAFIQTIDGIDEFNGQIKFTLNKDGEVIQVAPGDMVPGLNLPTTPRLSAEEAVKAAFVAIGNEFAGTLARSTETSGKAAFVNPRGSGYSPITA